VIDFLLIRNACMPPALLRHVLGHIPVLFKEFLDDGMVTSSLEKEGKRGYNTSPTKRKNGFVQMCMHYF
jgi:hypothetical protein